MDLEKNIRPGYEYHHFGIPTDIPREGERYSPTFKVYLTDGNNPFRIQWLRFEKESPFPELFKTQPHVAFKVKNLDEAIDGENVIVKPFYPFENFRVAVIEVEGAPIELIETSLTENEIWNTSHHNSLMYPEED